MIGDIIGKARVVPDPQHTQNYFEPLDTIAGATLDVLERNEDGDCLCFVGRSYLVMLDHRDVESFTQIITNSTLLDQMLRVVAQAHTA